jgi:demethoxyubiquinone hydroxylase (CLK1/Coq7/Cat5 family)
MADQNWSRFPKTYLVASRLSDGRKVATLEELERVIGLVLEGKLNELDSNSNSYRDTLKLLE